MVSAYQFFFRNFRKQYQLRTPALGITMVVWRPGSSMIHSNTENTRLCFEVFHPCVRDLKCDFNSSRHMAFVASRRFLFCPNSQWGDLYSVITASLVDQRGCNYCLQYVTDALQILSPARINCFDSIGERTRDSRGWFFFDWSALKMTKYEEKLKYLNWFANCSFRKVLSVNPQ